MDPAAPRSASAPQLLLLLLLLLVLQAERPWGAELTFELPDSAKQCFHEDVEQGARFSLDYQVGPRSTASRRCPAPGGLRRMGMFGGGPCTPGSWPEEPLQAPGL